MQGEKAALNATIAKLRLENVMINKLVVAQKAQATSELGEACRRQVELLTKQKNAELQQAINKKVQEWTKQKMSMETDLAT